LSDDERPRGGQAIPRPIKEWLFRGITLPVPPSMRYAPGVHHAPTGLRLPAIIAGVQSSQGAVSAIQRVFVRADGLGKAEVAKAKLSLGPLADGAVRLAPAAEVMAVCEGWETGLSALQLFGMPVWASLGASRMHRVRLPDIVRRVVIFADNDAAGREAAERTAQVHRDLGRVVEIRLPANGIDFNDELIARGTMK
jgi:DNA primase